MFSIVIFQQLGVQGKGFEPAVETLFGKNGFFPDTVLKTLYRTLDKLPGLVQGNMNEGVQVYKLLINAFISLGTSASNTVFIFSVP